MAKVRQGYNLPEDTAIALTNSNGNVLPVIVTYYGDITYDDPRIVFAIVDDGLALILGRRYIPIAKQQSYSIIQQKLGLQQNLINIRNSSLSNELCLKTFVNRLDGNKINYVTTREVSNIISQDDPRKVWNQDGARYTYFD